MTRGLPILFASLLLAAASAAVVPTIANVKGAPGDVVAIPFQVTGAGAVNIQAPPGLTALGASAESGSGVATLLLGTQARAGDYQVTLRQEGEGGFGATVTVTVTPVAGLELVLSGPSSITAGTTARYQVTATNSGNATDTYGLTLVSSDDASLDVTSLTLEPGQSQTLHLAIDPLGFGERVSHIYATSTLEPGYRKSLLIDYTALALGSSDPNAPFLAYVVPVSASYGSNGLDYGAGLSLSGDLSSVINTRDSLALLPTGQRASVGLFGSDWGVAYGYDSQLGHDLTVDVGPWTVRGSVTPQSRWTTGVSYWTGRWGLAYAHTWGPEASDTLQGTVAFGVGPAVTLTGSAGLRGEVWPDASYHVSPLLGGGLSWNGPVFVVNGRGTVAPWSLRPWQASLSVYSRQSHPVALNGSISADAGGFSLSAGAREEADANLTLTQDLGYQHNGGASGQADARLGMSLSVPGSPATMVALATAHLTSGVVTSNLNLTGTITQLPWVSAASADIGPGFTVAYGQTYVGPDYSVGGSVALPLGGMPAPTFGLQGAYAPSGVSLGGAVSYDTGSGAVSVSGSLGLPVLPTLALQGTVGYDTIDGLTWQIGAQASISGGVAVPKPVVDAFGGLDQGTVAGTVTARLPDGTVAPLPDVQVSIPSLERVTTTDAKGRYQMSVKPGNYQLGFPNLPPQYAPPSDLTVTAERQRTVRKDVQMTVSYAITGQVFIDRSGHGSAAGSSQGLRDVTVTLQDAGGHVSSVATGDNGSFVFRDLHEGSYTVAVASESLPPAYDTSTTPVTVEVGAGALPFVSLGVAPIQPTVTNTLNDGSLSLSAGVDPSHAPAGALVTVRADAANATSVTAGVPGGVSVALERQPDGTFTGDVSIPRSASAVALLHVHAASSTAAADQTVMVFITNAPLANLALDPGYAQPGQTVHVTAHFLYVPGQVSVRIGQSLVALNQTAPRTYIASVTAPRQAGAVRVELLDGEKVVTQASFEVQGK